MLPSSFSPWLVALSIALAVAVAYTSLELAARLADRPVACARGWLAGGACTMGLGIWSMHFVGMLAMSLPIELRYHAATTLASLVIAIVTSGFALALAGGTELRARRLVAGAAVMGAGISGMHYVGMTAIAVAPAVRYDGPLVAASVAVAFGASLAALWLAFHFRREPARRGPWPRLAAALVLGLAISGMHYTAMAATHFAAGSYCGSGIALNSELVAATTGMFALLLLGATLLTASYDAELSARTRQHARYLEHAHAALQHQALHDALTGLPNRRLALARIHEAIAASARDPRMFAVIELDLDRFKLVNDSLGTGVADQMLVAVGARLQQLVRPGDTVARVGGDEFLLLLRNLDGAAAALAVAERLHRAFDAAFPVNSVDLYATPSIGVALYPRDGTDIEPLLAHADEAMYCAQRAGGNGVQFFATSMTGATERRLDLECELRRALDSGQFELYYQPKVDVRSDRTVGAEALLRWHHPTRGLLCPGEFIEVAEETGLILPIGRWVLREACRQNDAWRRAGQRPLPLSVNVCALQFRQPDFLAMVDQALAEHALGAQYLQVELTESSVMNHAEQSVELLQALSERGVRVSIDDFGTGYSSMNYLRRFPLAELKIDRSFISDLAHNDDAAAIVRAVVSLAHSLRLQVVAEGVETNAQRERLRELGCDQYQGYLCNPALPAAELQAFLLEAAPAAAARPRREPEPLHGRLPRFQAARAVRA